MKSKIFFATCFGFILGNIIASRINFSLSTAFFLSLTTSGTLLFLVVRTKYIPKLFAQKLILFTSLLLSLSLGITRFVFVANALSGTQLSQFDGQLVEAIGVVKTEPVRKTDLSRLNIEINAVAKNGEVTKIPNEPIVVYADFFKEISYGDLVIIEGKLERIKNREEVSNFDFENYARKDKILFQIFRPEIKIERNVGNKVVLKLKSFKAGFEQNLRESLSEPHASLLSGMLISGKGVLPKSIQDDFVKTGLIHIVVLSGFNIAIIIRFLSSIFGFLKINRKISFVLVTSTLILFILMAGATPPVIRAVLMASIVLMGTLTYRQMDANKVLVFVATILCFINPYSAPFDPSFQLSFLATFAIINLTPIFERRILFIKNQILRETIAQTLSATVFVSPFILYLMGNFSVVALFVNVLVLPFVPVLMLFGFLTVLFSFIPAVSFLLSFITITLSSVLFFIVSRVASLPFASITVQGVPFVLVLIIYTLILWFLYKKKREVSTPVLNLTEPH